MLNFLEQLVAEWYEFQGYFVRRNIKVGKRSKGGHDGELDVVAYHPEKHRLVHIETSMDSDAWTTRQLRYEKKFRLGDVHIPALFHGFTPLPKIEKIAVLVYGTRKQRGPLGGGNVLMIDDLMNEIRTEISKRKVLNAAVPEQFVILRALQFAANYWK